ncbi:MAG: hypothetical protein HQK49_19925 [Oligoflexia bacterium]|nr:hypothetical protein [Oligoflexia bacterium]
MKKINYFSKLLPYYFININVVFFFFFFFHYTNKAFTTECDSIKLSTSEFAKCILKNCSPLLKLKNNYIEYPECLLKECNPRIILFDPKTVKDCFSSICALEGNNSSSIACLIQEKCEQKFKHLLVLKKCIASIDFIKNSIMLTQTVNQKINKNSCHKVDSREDLVEEIKFSSLTKDNPIIENYAVNFNNDLLVNNETNECYDKSLMPKGKEKKSKLKEQIRELMPKGKGKKSKLKEQIRELEKEIKKFEQLLEKEKNGFKKVELMYELGELKTKFAKVGNCYIDQIITTAVFNIANKYERIIDSSDINNMKNGKNGKEICTSVRYVSDAGITNIIKGGSTKTIFIKLKSAKDNPFIAGYIPKDPLLSKANPKDFEKLQQEVHKMLNEKNKIKGFGLPTGIAIPVKRYNMTLVYRQNKDNGKIQYSWIEDEKIKKMEKDGFKIVEILADPTALKNVKPKKMEKIMKEWKEKYINEYAELNYTAKEMLTLFNKFLAKEVFHKENLKGDPLSLLYKNSKLFVPDCDILLSSSKGAKYSNVNDSSDIIECNEEGKKDINNSLQNKFDQVIKDEINLLAKNLKFALSKDRYLGDLVNHGPESKNFVKPQDLADDYPVKFYCSDGVYRKVYTIPIGPFNSPHKNLILFINQKNHDGHFMLPNPDFVTNEKEKEHWGDFSHLNQCKKKTKN